MDWFLCAKIVGGLICLIGLVLQSLNIFTGFATNQSSIGITYDVEDRMELPSITICPAKSTKYPLDKRTASDQKFVDATYSKEELIFTENEGNSNWKFKGDVS